MKKSFILYTDIYDCIKTLPIEEKGKLLDTIFKYVIDKNETQLKPVAKMAFNFIKTTLDRDELKYKDMSKLRAEFGRQGGLKSAQKRWGAKNKPNKQSKQKLTPSQTSLENNQEKISLQAKVSKVTVSDSDNDSVSDIGNPNEENDLENKQTPKLSPVQVGSPQTTPRLIGKDLDAAWDLAEKLSAKKVEEERMQK